jgi:hypothetical protein
VKLVRPAGERRNSDWPRWRADRMPSAALPKERGLRHPAGIPSRSCRNGLFGNGITHLLDAVGVKRLERPAPTYALRRGFVKAFVSFTTAASSAAISSSVRQGASRRIRSAIAGRLTCESCLAIDVREWKRRGFLRPGQLFPVSWNRACVPCGSISVRTHSGHHFHGAGIFCDRRTRDVTSSH